MKGVCYSAKGSFASTNGSPLVSNGVDADLHLIRHLPIGFDHLCRAVGESAWKRTALPSRELLDVELHSDGSRKRRSENQTLSQAVNYRFDAVLDGIIVSCGAHSASTKRFVIHSGVQLVVPKFGSSQYAVRGGPSFSVTAGSEAAILGPGEYQSKSSDVASLVVQLDDPSIVELSELARQIGITLITSNLRIRDLRHPRFAVPIGQLQQAFQSLCAKKLTAKDARSVFLELLLDLLKIENQDSVGISTGSRKHCDLTLDRVLAFIQANIHREITNHEICQTLDISLPLLFRICRASTGSTPQVWIQSLRLHRALDLIKHHRANINLKMIAIKVGYHHYQEFRSHFRHQFSLTPEQVQICLNG